jgi:phosphatidylserine decarboxylase
VSTKDRVLGPSRAGRLPLAREGLPFIVTPLALAAVGYAAGWYVAAAALLVLGGFCAYFFRDPRRTGPEDPALVLAPADGRVTVVRDGPDGLRVGIFLSIFDVHVNRTPLAGRVLSSRHTAGRFLAAFRPEAESANERHEIELATEFGTVRVTQIAGLIARRIVCRLAPGDRVARGERYGLIRFGSRTDVTLPPGAVALVERGDRVIGGVSPVARLERSAGVGP